MMKRNVGEEGLSLMQYQRRVWALMLVLEELYQRLKKEAFPHFSLRPGHRSRHHCLHCPPGEGAGVPWVATENFLIVL